MVFKMFKVYLINTAIIQSKRTWFGDIRYEITSDTANKQNKISLFSKGASKNFHTTKLAITLNFSSYFFVVCTARERSSAKQNCPEFKSLKCYHHSCSTSIMFPSRYFRCIQSSEIMIRWS